MLRIASRGYQRRAVEQFLARCASSLGDRAVEVPELHAVRRPERPSPALDAGDVRAMRFPVVLRGYDMGQVDDVLARVARALPGTEARPTWDDAPVPAPAAVPGPALRRRLRGYDVAEVDAFLVCCAHTLGRRVATVPELVPLLSRPRNGTPLRARDVEVVQFRIRVRGYDVDQVDTLLDRVSAALTG